MKRNTCAIPRFSLPQRIFRIAEQAVKLQAKMCRARLIRSNSIPRMPPGRWDHYAAFRPLWKNGSRMFTNRLRISRASRSNVILSDGFPPHSSDGTVSSISRFNPFPLLER
jgi:hypothetical protein